MRGVEMTGLSVDVLVIGAGIAGLTAAATAASHGLETLVVEHMAAGGQVATVERIHNLPGFAEGVAGYELGPLLQQQAEEAGARFLMDTVDSVHRAERGFEVACASGIVLARTVIVAAGSSRRKLDVPGEAALEGRGVSHCAACDGPFFRGAITVIAGGGDSAFDEALVLAEQAGEVVIVHKGPAPKARRAAVTRAAAEPKIRVVANAEIVGIVGEGEVTGVALQSETGAQTIAAAGIFVYVGLAPNSGFLGNLVETDAGGRIVTDATLQSSCPGLFAAGDIRAESPYLLASAAGDGAAAALGAIHRLALA
jgi:thioredoxin reductase (NADPH)